MAVAVQSTSPQYNISKVVAQLSLNIRLLMNGNDSGEMHHIVNDRHKVALPVFMVTGNSPHASVCRCSMGVSLLAAGPFLMGLHVVLYLMHVLHGESFMVQQGGVHGEHKHVAPDHAL